MPGGAPDVRCVIANWQPFHLAQPPIRLNHNKPITQRGSIKSQQTYYGKKAP